MPGPAHGRLRQQIDTLRREFLQEGELPFTDVLSSGGLTEAMAEVTAPWKDRIFTPLVTLRVFLGQVLNADQSCRAAVGHQRHQQDRGPVGPQWLAGPTPHVHPLTSRPGAAGGGPARRRGG